MLPRGARVLDLATGDGRVLRWLGAANKGLKLFGIDAAPTLPPPPAGTKVKAGVAMEKLPFPAARFDAVTSQFGFEYGDVERTAAEVARVLKPGGTVGLIVHRGDGPILAHNARRGAALEWIVEENRLLEAVRQGNRLGRAAFPGLATRTAEIAGEAERRFGQNSPAWEIAEAVRRALAYELRTGAGLLGKALADIEGSASNELGRIASLRRACGTADDRDTFYRALANHGLGHREERSVLTTNGERFADFLRFEKLA
jgi:SAM-dependent methyltransferase